MWLLHHRPFYSMTETWKAIPGYEGLYEVSDLGRVRSLDYNRTRKTKIMKTRNDGRGYLQVQFYKDGISKKMKVHRLVADAFIPNPNNLETVNHKDEDKTNNTVSNLEWMSREDNNIYSKARQVQMLNKQTGELLAIFPSTHEAERVTGIYHSHISKCCNGKLKSSGGYIWRYA